MEWFVENKEWIQAAFVIVMAGLGTFLKFYVDAKGDWSEAFKAIFVALENIAIEGGANVPDAVIETVAEEIWNSFLVGTFAAKLWSVNSFKAAAVSWYRKMFDARAKSFARLARAGYIRPEID